MAQQSITITPYAIRVRASRSKDHFPLNKISHDGVSFDFMDFLDSYLAERKTGTRIDHDAKQGIRVSTTSRSARETSGVIEGGAFGYAAELRNVQTNTVKQKELNDCEFVPFYFRIEHKQDQNEAILVLQRFGVKGVKSPFHEDLAEALKKRHADLILEMNPLVTKNEISRILGGGIKRIRYLRSTIPSDVANDISLDDNQEDQCEMETVVKAKRNSLLQIPKWVNDLAKGRVAAGGIVEVNGIEYEDVKVVISNNGQNRTLDLSEITSKVRMAVDVTEQVDFDKNTGHPVPDSVDKAVRELIPEIRKELGWDDA